ncbi:ABC transporter substrate-binding protein [Candidatus Pacearchaeota archaeon]|nr:ABC transporter substrate-binding protein [Candidatus Pacearchaeota archaeon]
MKNLVKITIGIAIIIFAAFGFMYFGNMSGKVVDGDKEEIRIGAIIPLTGTYSTLGIQIKNGMELAKINIEKEGNIKIKTYYEDVCLSKDAVNAVYKLINVDKIDVIGGSYCVIGLIPNVPILEKEKIIAFSTPVNPDNLLNHAYVFSTNKAIRDDSWDMADFSINKLYAKRAATIYFNTDLGMDYNKYFKEHFESLGGRIVSQNMYELSSMDFRSELTKIKNSNPDVILAINLGGNMGNLLKQAREMGLSIPIIGYVHSEDPNVLTAAGNAAEGFIVSSSETQEKSKLITDFQEKYRNQYGIEPDINAVNAYDAIKLEVFAYQKCSGDPDCMVEVLHNIKDYEGVSGNITIQEDGSTIKPTVFKIVKDGKFVRIE